MLLNKFIKVKVSNRTKKYFFEKGYIEDNGYFMVLPEDMNDSNRTKVKCECEYCGVINDVTWSNYILQMNKAEEKIYSCHKCHFNKTKIIFMKNYGVDNIQILDQIKNKIKETCIERYGVEYSIISKEVKDKIKETCIKKYGVEYSIISKEVKDKIKETCIEKYGVENPFCSNSKFRKDINEKLKITLNKDCVKNKRNNTCYERYGFNNPMKIDYIKNKSKNTCIERYGVRSPMQSSFIFNKQQKSGLKIKEYENSNLSYQGTYEFDFLEKYHDRVKIEKINPIQYFLNENSHYYHPDFYLPDYNLIIEIKSSYTYNYDIDKNLAKKKYSIESGYNFMFIIDKDYTDLNSILGITY